MGIVDEIRQLFDYRDGALYWRVKRRGTKGIGSRAGHVDPKTGRTHLRISYQPMLLHRAIWMWHNGEIPEDMVIDHINRDHTDHRIENLRCCTRAENLLNREVGKNSTTGHKNITMGRDGKYRVSLHREFPTLEDAIEYRNRARNALHDEFSCP